MPADPKPTPEAPVCSKQGYDKCFATNFLGHYLLTESLLPVLKSTGNARILHIASSAHLQVGGNGLKSEVCGDGTMSAPLAARSDVYTMSQWVTSYANSKLAQLLHQRYLHQSLQMDKDSNGLKVLAVCPGFVATGMVPNGPLGSFLAKRFYPVDAAVYTPLYTLLCPDSDISSGEFLTNFYNGISSSFLGKSIYNFFTLIGMRSYFVGVLGIPWVITFQHTSFGVHRTPVSDAASDDHLAQGFVKWCTQAVQEYTQ